MPYYVVEKDRERGREREREREEEEEEEEEEEIGESTQETFVSESARPKP